MIEAFQDGKDAMFYGVFWLLGASFILFWAYWFLKAVLAGMNAFGPIATKLRAKRRAKSLHDAAARGNL